MADKTVTSPDAGSGKAPYTEDDLRSALSIIACQASNLRDFLVDAQATAMSAEGCVARVSTDLVMAQYLVEYIGSIADQMGGCRFIGGAASWASMEGIKPLEVRHG